MSWITRIVPQVLLLSPGTDQTAKMEETNRGIQVISPGFIDIFHKWSYNIFHKWNIDAGKGEYVKARDSWSHQQQRQDRL